MIVISGFERPTPRADDDDDVITMYRLELTSIISSENCHSSSDILLRPMASESLWWNLFLFDKQVDQGLHRFHLFISHESVILGNGDEVDKAHVEDLIFIQMPERVKPVAVIEMGVAAEHLFHDPLAIFVEGLREAT